MVTGPVYYTSAPALEAYSARAWEPPVAFFYSAYRMKLVADSKNVLHMMYVNYYGREPGIYYTHWKMAGETGSALSGLTPTFQPTIRPTLLSSW